MGSRQITNPMAAYTTVTDYRTGVDAAGADLAYERKVEQFRANATIVKGQALMWVAPTATVPLSVTPMTAAVSASDAWLFAGAAMESAEAGDTVAVLREGFGVVQTETADTPAFGNALCLPDTTTGDFATPADSPTGGAQVGVVLGPEIGTTDTAWVYLGWVATETTA